MQICYNCNTTLSIDKNNTKIHFCPFCGKVQINNKLIHHINTYNYDPNNPRPWRYRPWKDKSNYSIPHRRKYVIENKTKIPWIAVMKNPSRYSNNKWKNKNKYSKSRHDDVTTVDHDHYHNTLHKNEYNIDKLNHHSVIINNDDDNLASGRIAIDPDVFIELYRERIVPVAVYRERVVPVAVYRERVVPVAVYEATWLPSSFFLENDHADDGHLDDHDHCQFDNHHDDSHHDDSDHDDSDHDVIDDERSSIINISLVEQSFGKSNHHHIYWLRIGLLVNMMNNYDDNSYCSSSNCDDAVSSMKLISAYESNDDNDRKYDDSYCSSLKDLKTKSDSAVYAKVDDNDDRDDSDKDHTQLYVLGMLSNDACRYMIPNISDWVELYAINPEEYYMSQHLQHILSYIASRITLSNNIKDQQYQLNYNVFMKHKINVKALYYSYHITSTTSKTSPITTNNIHNNNGGTDRSSSSGNDSDDKHGYMSSNNNYKKGDNENDDDIVENKTFQQIKDKIDEYQVWMYDIDHHDNDIDNIDDRTTNKRNSNTDSNNNNLKRNLNNRIDDIPSLFNLSFDPWSIQINYPITLTRGKIIKKCLSRVRLTLLYNNQLLQSKIKISSGNSQSHDSNINDIAKYQLTYDQFKQTQLITHIKLHIIPLAIDFISIIPTAIITIDILTIQYLLRHIYPDGFNVDDIFSSSNSNGSSSRSNSSSNSSSSIDADCLTNSTHHSQLFMKYLISMIKIDNTDDGIKYSIVGAFSKPNYISCSWSYDDDVMDRSNGDDSGSDNDADDDFNNINIIVGDVK